VRETVQVLRGGHARAYVVAEEREDGSLLLAPEPVPTPQDEAAARDGHAAAVVPEVAGILQVRDLTVAYGPKTAVDAVSFEIRRGEIFGLLGPNGAGKTSTLSAIEGLLKPRSRAILLEAEANEPFKQLSGGQQQRLSLYIAVVHDPGTLLTTETLHDLIEKHKNDPRYARWPTAR
jgi:ABC-type Fe3+/spermidine/putrescine transport system ATPase subunit